MQHVLWIGGPPGSGKTAIATRLARRHGLRLYSADTRTWVHRDRAIAAGNAAARRFESLPPAARWECNPAEMLEMSLHAERGAMVVDDVRSLPDAPLIVAEGSTVPPALISSGIADPSRAVWLLPTPAFQESQLTARATPRGPSQLYRLLNRVIEHDAREHGAPTLTIDGTRGVMEMLATVEEHFSAPLRAGPRAETLDERRRLLHEVNEAIVTQVHGYYARSWAEGEPSGVIRSFVCECGQRTCDDELAVTVSAAAAAPVLVPGHSPVTR